MTPVPRPSLSPRISTWSAESASSSARFEFGEGEFCVGSPSVDATHTANMRGNAIKVRNGNTAIGSDYGWSAENSIRFSFICEFELNLANKAQRSGRFTHAVPSGQELPLGKRFSDRRLGIDLAGLRYDDITYASVVLICGFKISRINQLRFEVKMQDDIIAADTPATVPGWPGFRW